MDDIARTETRAESIKIGALIRARRHALHMTLQTLGQGAGVSVGYLSQVERDNASPSLSTLAAIAAALDVGVDYFIGAPDTHEALTRGRDRVPLLVGDPLIAYERLHAEFPGSALSAFLITIAPGYRSEATSHEGEEIIYVLEGELTLRIGEDTLKVGPEDSLHFRGNRSHFWANEGAVPVRLVWSGNLTMFRSSDRGSAFRTAPAPETV